MTNPATPETGERCPDCDRPNCRRDAVQVYKSVERIACYEHAIIRLRSELSTLREREKLLVDAVQAAVDRSDRSAPKERDNISRNTLVEDLGRALLAHRQRSNDGNR
jgi:hypothetical protein